MKTILVVYTDIKLADTDKMKRYAFNTEDGLEVNDVIKSPSYSTNMQVVKVLEEEYKYYNAQTGELSNNYTSTLQFLIRDLVIQKYTHKNVIFATFVSRETDLPF